MLRTCVRILSLLAVTGCTINGFVGGSAEGGVDAPADHSTQAPDGSRADVAAANDAHTKPDVGAHDAGVDATSDAHRATSDATSDAADAAVDHAPGPDAGFTFSASPAHVTEDPGDSFPITVNLDRIEGFSDALTITVNGLPTGATATALTIPGAQSGGVFSLGVSAGATVTNADVDLTVVAANGTGTVSATAPLVLRLGSLLSPDGTGTYVVPSYATMLLVKAWGAGGGGGGINGGPGGGGGFVSATLPVIASETLDSVVGTGGTDNGGGAGGGGFTGLQRGTSYILIAGAGGGGGWSFNYPLQGTDRTGGGGGGSTGQQGPDPLMGGGRGGTQSAAGAGGGAGGVGAGSSLQGGNAANANQPGGVPGGGFGGVDESDSTGGGGGGGGYFGGGAGAETSTLQGTGGGGGGSGYVDPSGINPVLTAANLSTCANTTDLDYVSGVGAGGPGGPEGKPNGGDGLLVVRLTRP